MKEIYKELALGYKGDYDDTCLSIRTFEGIIKDKAIVKENKTQAKAVLKILYKQRDRYEQKANQYRALYNASEGRKRALGWNKGGN